MLKAVPCSAHHTTLACLCGFRGDDFCTEGEAEVPDQVDAMITTRFKGKILPRVGPVVSLGGRSCCGSRRVTSCISKATGLVVELDGYEARANADDQSNEDGCKRRSGCGCE